MKYLEELLNGATVEWKTLGEIMVRTKGTKITANQMKSIHRTGAPLKIFAGGKTVAFVEYEDIPEKDITKEPSIIVKSRGIIEFEYYDKPFSHKNEMWAYHSESDTIYTKFVYHFLKIHEPYFQGLAKKMQMPQISIPDTDRFLIPIPPIDVQRKIVEILDNFAELTARQKQYEYYRDNLLTFSNINGGG